MIHALVSGTVKPGLAQSLAQLNRVLKLFCELLLALVQWYGVGGKQQVSSMLGALICEGTITLGPINVTNT